MSIIYDPFGYTSAGNQNFSVLDISTDDVLTKLIKRYEWEQRCYLHIDISDAFEISVTKRDSLIPDAS